MVWRRYIPVFLLLPAILIAELTVEHRSPAELVLEYTLDGSSYDTVLVGGEKMLLPHIPDGIVFAKPCEPSLPSLLVRVGIPPDGDVKLTIEHIRTDTINGSPAPVESLVVRNGISNYIRYKGAIYRSRAVFPNLWCVEDRHEGIRSQKIARIIINPFRFNPVDRTIIVCSEMRVKVVITGNTNINNPTNDRYFEKLFKNMLVNYNDARGWRTPAKRAKAAVSEPPYNSGAQWYKIRIGQDGLYRLSGAWLSAHGFGGAENVRIFTGGGLMLPSRLDDGLPEIKEVPAIDDGGNLVFYAVGAGGFYLSDGVMTGEKHLYDTLNTYFIAIGGDFDSPPSRLAPTAIHSDIEDTMNYGFTFYHYEELRYWESEVIDGNETWFWERLSERNAYITDTRISTGVSPNFYAWASPTPSRVLVDGDSAARGSFEHLDGVVFSTDISSPSAAISIEYGGEVQFRRYRVAYAISLRPASGTLRFASFETGAKRFMLTGFSSAPLVLDITDRLGTRYFAVNATGGGGFTFADTASDREYIAIDESRVNTYTGIVEAVSFTLRNRSNGADYLFLTPATLDPSRLAAFRESYNGMSTDIIPLSQIMTEFGFGVYDPSAVRDFLRFTYENWTPTPSFVALVGDGHFDFLHNITSEPILFPMAYPATSRYTDEWFVSLNSESGPDMYVGRLSVKNQSQLDAVMNKTIDYESNPEYGFWRIVPISVADDEYTTTGLDGSKHSEQQSALIEHYIVPFQDPAPLYMTDYPRNTAKKKPEASAALIRMWNDGGVVINYIGHGNHHLWAHEEIFEASADIPELNNGYKLPFVSSFSCNVGKYYLDYAECISEQVVRKESDGAIASLGATGKTTTSGNGSYNRSLWRLMFQTTPKDYLGEIVYLAKNGYYRDGASVNDAMYILFGDPALTLAYPRYTIRLALTSDTLIGGELCTVSGTVTDSIGNPLGDFTGTAEIRARDSQFMKHYISPAGVAPMDYIKPGALLYKGDVDVTGGHFDVSFVVPLDISSGTSFGKIIAYAWDDDLGDAAGVADSLTLVRSSLAITDSTGPDIQMWMCSKSFVSGGTVPRNPTIIANISDESGINITGDVGHCIMAYLDENQFNQIDLTPYFAYYQGSYTSGELEHRLENLSVGAHTLTLVIWDNVGNSSSGMIDFVVSEENEALFDVLPYPSPFKDRMSFTFGLTATANIDIFIYSLSGRLIRHIEGEKEPPFGWFEWDGTDKHGTPVANGVYIYVLSAKFDNGESTTVKGKIARTR